MIASGFGTPLLKMVGLGGGDSLEHMIGCQAKVAARGLVETEVYLGSALAPGSFAWLVPLRGTTALAGMVSQERGGGHMSSFLDMLRDGGTESTRCWSRRAAGAFPSSRCRRRSRTGSWSQATRQAWRSRPPEGGIYYSLLSGELAARGRGRRDRGR